MWISPRNANQVVKGDLRTICGAICGGYPIAKDFVADCERKISSWDCDFGCQEPDSELRFSLRVFEQRKKKG